MPTNLRRILLGPTSFTLSWQPPYPFTGTPSYDLSLDGGATVYAANLTLPRYVVEGLLPSTYYTPVVRVRSGSGPASSWCTPLSITTLATGAAPVSTPPVDRRERRRPSR